MAQGRASGQNLIVTPSIELLLPAGNFEKMKYAIAFGADAVYLGIPRFSLRARENGFKTLAQVAEAVKYAHLQNKKVYLTANIFAHNIKVDQFAAYVADVLEVCRPDAWIVSDPGLIMLMREHFPAEIIHISVQSNVINYASARFWQGVGARRIILSREISIREMQAIHQACPELELESFVHGSVCIAYSGRCLISNYLTHRDSNQGICTNSCRWQYQVHRSAEPAEEYSPLKEEFFLEESERKGILFPVDEDENGTYLMNAKDLCAIQHLAELFAAGITSFKVEGRSKTVYYAAMIARAYRRAIDDVLAGKPFDPDHLNEVMATSTRGFNEGFLHGDPGPGAQEYTNSHSSGSTYRFSGIVRGYDASRQRLNIEPRNPLKVGHSYELCTPIDNVTFTITSLFDSKERSRGEIHGGLHACYIPYPKDPGPFALMREKIG
jgi:putative protease